jgi:hypothetical protein
MSEFRGYVIGWDGHILQRIELDNCSDESEAREKAKQLVDGHDVELWERARLIERFRHQEQIASVSGLARALAERILGPVQMLRSTLQQRHNSVPASTRSCVIEGGAAAFHQNVRYDFPAA